MGEEPESISGLFAQLADDASGLVRAEVELYRAAALHRLALSRTAFVFLAGSLVVSFAAVSTLLVMLAIGLSRWIGPVGGGLVVSVCALIAAAVLAKLGFNRLIDAVDEVHEEKP